MQENSLYERGSRVEMVVTEVQGSMMTGCLLNVEPLMELNCSVLPGRTSK